MNNNEKKITNATDEAKHFFRFACLCFIFSQALTYASISVAFSNKQNLENLKLSTEVKDALDNGISLTFDCLIQNNKHIWFLSIPQDRQKNSFTLTHHSLSNRYLVSQADFLIPKNFDSAENAIAFIKEQTIKLFDNYSAKNATTTIRLSLNKYKLLGPMRLNAFIAQQWNIDSGWISWTTER